MSGQSELVADVTRRVDVGRNRVASVIRLLDDGCTVPFIARYRKEATGGVDEVAIRDIAEARQQLEALAKRRETVLEAIESQGKLTPEVREAIERCETRTELEDLYLPYRKKRRTRAEKARRRGLEPLADRILQQPDDGDPRAEAREFVREDADDELAVPDVDAALAGARDIVAETIAHHPDVRGYVREVFEGEGLFVCRAVEKKTRGKRTKFEQYYDHSEKVATIPSHRFLAIQRGESEGLLRAHIDVETERVWFRILRIMGRRRQSPFAGELEAALEDGWKRLLAPSIESDVRVELKLRSDRAAVDVFAKNLRTLLLAPPLGERPVLGVDPGLRTGCKCAAVDATGRYLESATIYPHSGKGKRDQATRKLETFLARHTPEVVAVGNGTAGRETATFVREVVRESDDLGAIDVVLVSESGASIYSASEIAREEFPELDLTVRGAISIARRLQDPLAELVKLDPKSIGVGQYQHDVHQPLLRRKLDEVVESCVNAVGVDLNTASAPLLSYVSGIGATLAQRVVAHREATGRFETRSELLDVTGIGPRTHEQAAGFLRVTGERAHPLDSSAVHPERYALVEQMADDLGVELETLVGNARLAKSIQLEGYRDEDVGLPTLHDIVDELARPGRDPRDAFEPMRFRDDVRTIEDLKSGMTLNGVVTNVTHFGAFVDVGVKQDGLVHISELANRYVRDPNEEVSVGDQIRVRVLDVDLERQRIGLSRKRVGD